MKQGNQENYKIGPWRCETLPEDGGRISRLTWRGYELLTSAPDSFQAPEADYGEYETRPVYGYDDCFPSLEPCPFPGRDEHVPDHGACWKTEADVWREENVLGARYQFDRYMATLERRMEFEPDRLTWRFTVHNESEKPFPFLHVMHPVMPPDLFVELELPDFERLEELERNDPITWSNGDELSAFLLEPPGPGPWMFMLQRIHNPVCELGLRGGSSLTIRWDRELFPTLGIWWNRNGYPDESGLERDECAFEPIPAPTSSLQKAYESGNGLNAPPGESMRWCVVWEMEPTQEDE